MDQLDPWTLRKEGKPDKALEVVRRALELDPENSSVRLCGFWCAYDLAKAKLEILRALDGSSSLKDKECALGDCVSHLVRMMEYYIDGDYQRSTVGWFAAKCAWEASQVKRYDAIAQIVNEYRKAISEPDAQPYHSLFLNVALSIDPAPAWLGEFLEYWDLENLREDDFRSFEGKEGSGRAKHKPRSLAAKAVSAAAKFLAEHSEASCEWFETRLPRILVKLEDDSWVCYHVAQYYHARGRRGEAIKYASKALYATRGNAAVWSLLSLVMGDLGYSEAAFACAVEAVSRDEIICGRRAYEVIVRELKQRGERTYAQELEDILALLPEVFKSSNSQEQSRKHKEFAAKVRGVLQKHSGDRWGTTGWDQLEESGVFHRDVVIVESINPAKKVIWVRSRPDDEGGPLMADPFTKRDILEWGAGVIVDVLKDAATGTVHAARRAASERIPDFVKEIAGRITLHRGDGDKPFGFLKADGISAFVAPYLISEHQLKDGSTVSALAMKSYDKKRRKEGWKVIRILPPAQGG